MDGEPAREEAICSRSWDGSRPSWKQGSPVLAPGVRAHGHPPTPPTHQTQTQSRQLPWPPPGPGLSAQGWGAKPRGGERRGQEGERAKEKRAGSGCFKTSAGSRTSFDRGSVRNYIKYITTHTEYNLHVVTSLGWLRFAGCKHDGFVDI